MLIGHADTVALGKHGFYILTAGGPGDTTTLSGYLIFRTGLREFNVGAAAAMTLVFVFWLGTH